MSHSVTEVPRFTGHRINNPATGRRKHGTTSFSARPYFGREAEILAVDTRAVDACRGLINTHRLQMSFQQARNGKVPLITLPPPVTECHQLKQFHATRYRCS